MRRVDAPSASSNDFEQVLDEFAKRMTYRDDVIVAKLDLTTNDVSKRVAAACVLFPKGGGKVTDCHRICNIVKPVAYYAPPPYSGGIMYWWPSSVRLFVWPVHDA